MVLPSSIVHTVSLSSLVTIVLLASKDFGCQGLESPVAMYKYKLHGGVISNNKSATEQTLMTDSLSVLHKYGLYFHTQHK